jgi:hypothetical protein
MPPWLEHRRVQRGGADQFQHLVEPCGMPVADKRRDCAVVDEGFVCPAFTKQANTLGLAGRRGDIRTMLLRDCGRSQTDRSCAATDQERIAITQLQGREERSPGGLKHLGHRSQNSPLQCRGDNLHLPGGHACVLGVAPVELPAHASHTRRNRFSHPEFISRCIVHRANGFNSQHAWKSHTGRMPLARKEFRSV